MRMLGFINKTIPEDKRKGTKEEKCIFYPFDKLSNLLMVAFDEIRQIEAKTSKTEAQRLEMNAPDNFELVQCRTCMRKFAVD